MPKNYLTFIPVFLWIVLSNLGLTLIALIGFITIFPALIIVQAVAEAYRKWKEK